MELHVALGPPLRQAAVILGLAIVVVVAVVLDGGPDDSSTVVLLCFAAVLLAVRVGVAVAALRARQQGQVAIRIDSDGITRSGEPLVSWSRMETVRVRYFWGPLAHPRRLHQRARVIQFLLAQESRFANRAGTKPVAGLIIGVANYDATLDEVLAAVRRYSTVPIQFD
ncbi:hypothetical protein FOE78_04615 [Microlunatus elymi]|uniref:PH domain-containing protein n=1 Tax=Microlunatus elymi TaxID=2596828 RepID=A0A516PVS4_9ACTN|nr:hypothetical protein [Microlunatus elymi]QDP95286.1 hypothetical protein FOE78_04615 [Microlunatus elymi]